MVPENNQLTPSKILTQGQIMIASSFAPLSFVDLGATGDALEINFLVPRLPLYLKPLRFDSLSDIPEETFTHRVSSTPVQGPGPETLEVSYKAVSANG